MTKRSWLLILVICLLACVPWVGFAEEIRLEAGTAVFPPEVLGKLSQQCPEKKSLATDLTAIMPGYPAFCRGVELRQD